MVENTDPQEAYPPNFRPLNPNVRSRVFFLKTTMTQRWHEYEEQKLVKIHRDDHHELGIRHGRTEVIFIYNRQTNIWEPSHKFFRESRNSRNFHNSSSRRANDEADEEEEEHEGEV